MALAVVVSGIAVVRSGAGSDAGVQSAVPAVGQTQEPTPDGDALDGAAPAGAAPDAGSAAVPVDGSEPLDVSAALGAPLPVGEPQRAPRSVEDWIDRALPVAGTVVAAVPGVVATVRIERLGDDTAAIRTDGMALPPGHRAVRLVLTSDPTPDLDALPHADALPAVPVSGTASGDGDVSASSTIVADATSLQADVRAAALVDDDTGQVLGVALLVPVD